MVELRASLRVLKPQNRRSKLERRADAALRWVEDEPRIGGELLLDTTVYLDVLQGRSPEALDSLLEYRVCRHSSVCLAELTHPFGRLDPAHPATAAVLASIRSVIDDIPAHRLHAPEPVTWGEAGMLGGELVRRTGRKMTEACRSLADALIFLQARRLGITVLTGNVRDFDLLSQIVPSVAVHFYKGVRASTR